MNNNSDLQHKFYLAAMTCWLLMSIYGFFSIFLDTSICLIVILFIFGDLFMLIGALVW